jgi:cyclopropane fatty-acyl-phospholipid synthase-like methyltransferase
MGPNPLVLTEWLCQGLDLGSGQRVLDLGCGKCLSSEFLAREFDVQVWATDLWIPASDNAERIRKANLDDRVFPIHADARELPFASDFFDAIVCVDSYFYYGTDERYLSYLVDFVRRGCPIGIVVPAMMQTFQNGVPEHLARKQSHGTPFWTPEGDCWSFHTTEWWRNLLSQRDLLVLELVDTLADGWKIWAQHERALELALKAKLIEGGPFPSDAEALENDRGQYLGFVRAVGRRN